MASLTCLHLRDTRSLLEVRLSLECRWPAACSEELCQPPDFLVGTCLEISQLLAQRSPLLTTCLLPGETGDSARDQTSCPTRIPERCSSGPNGMTCFARRPTLSSTGSLLNLTSMWYSPRLMDPVSSTSSQKAPSIPRCTNVLTSSHRLLLSWSRLQPFKLRGWIPPVPPASATCCPTARPRHPVEGVIDRELSLRSKPKGVPTAPSPGSTSGSPGSKLKSSRPPRCARLSWSTTPETSDQRLGLHTSTCLATRRESVCVCASSNPHRCLETRGVSPLYKPCAARPIKLSSSLFANTAAPLCTCTRDVLGRVALKSCSASSSLRVTKSG